MARKPEWKIYYADGSTFSDLDGHWESAPGRRIVCVVTIDPTETWGRWVLHNFDYYYRVSGHEVMGSNSRRTMRDHVPDLRYNQIKYGCNVWQEVWQGIMARAGHDPDFPAKTPRRRRSDWC